MLNGFRVSRPTAPPTSTPAPPRSSETSENAAKVSTPVVVDASAGVEILLQTPIGRRLLAQLPLDAEEWVPELYLAEVAGVLRHRAIEQCFPAARLEAALGRLLTWPVRRVQVQPLLHEARQIGQNLTIAGATYVVLARHLGAPLVTTDRRLAATPGLAITTVVA